MAADPAALAMFDWMMGEVANRAPDPAIMAMQQCRQGKHPEFEVQAKIDEQQLRCEGRGKQKPQARRGGSSRASRAPIGRPIRLPTPVATCTAPIAPPLMPEFR